MLPEPPPPNPTEWVSATETAAGLPWQRTSRASMLPIDGQTFQFVFAVILGGINANVVGAIVFGAIALLLNAVRWWFTKWCVADGTVWLQRGIIRREQRRIPLGRAQEVEIVQPPLLRLFGLARIRVETGAGLGQSELAISGLRYATAIELSHALRPPTTSSAVAPNPVGSGPDVDHEEADHGPPGALLVRLSNRRLAVAGLTGPRLALPFVATVGLFAQLQGFGFDPFDGRLESAGVGVIDRSQTLSALALSGIVFGLVVLWMVGAAAAGVVTDHGMEASVVDGRLRVERGLFTRRRNELELDRCQTVSLIASVSRRLTGTHDLVVRVASVGEGLDPSGHVRIPMLRSAEIERICRILPGDLDPFPTFDPAPPAARQRQFVDGILEPLLLTALAAPPLWIFVSPVVAIATAVVLVGFGLGAGELYYRGLGVSLTERQLAARRGALRREHTILPLDQAQVAEVISGPRQRWWGLATVTVSGAGSANRVNVVDQRGETCRLLLGVVIPP